MSWSIRIGRFAGTDVKIHVTFLLLLAWIGFAHYARGGAAAAFEGVLFICLLFGCVLLHEFGHALMARVYGIQTPDITLLPIGGLARLQRMPDKPMEELLVALAGPAVNMVIAGVLFAVLGRVTDFTELQRLEDPGVSMIAKLATVNVILVVFNLIPAFPMDGGRVLRALLASFMNYARATQIAATVGQGIAFVFGFLGLFGNPLLLFIALFVYLGASQEAAMAQMRDLARGVAVSAAMVTEFVTLPSEATLADAVEAVIRTSQHEFPVIEDGGRVLGLLMQDDMIAAIKAHGTSLPVREVMRSDLPAVQADQSFDSAFREMQECQCPALPVLDRAGQLVGLITTENVGEMMLIRSVLPDGVVPSWRAARKSATL